MYYGIIGFMSQYKTDSHFRREYMFIENKGVFHLIPKGLYVENTSFFYVFTYNPFGIEQHFIRFFYKHIFPSGIFKRHEFCDRKRTIPFFFAKIDVKASKK